VLIWASASRTPWRELGFARPHSWPRTVVAGVLMGVALKLVMKAVVMPLLDAPPRNAAYRFLVGNEASLPYMIFASIVIAGVGEEVITRGFLFERGRRLVGDSAAAKIAVVAVSSAWFGLGHYPEQGWPGVQQALVVGVLYGTIYAVSGRLWMLMTSHAVFDLTAVAIIYLDLEDEVAGFFFG
jgi:membrane protease YdiL (CAAX protease family)